MTVYIDSLFMINFFADSALLFFVQLFTKRNTGCIRIMLGAVFLSLYSLGSVFESVSFLYGIIPKATVCCLTLLFVFGKSGYPKTFAVFWCSAMLETIEKSVLSLAFNVSISNRILFKYGFTNSVIVSSVVI